MFVASYGAVAIILDTTRYDTVYLRALKSCWDAQRNRAHGTETKK